MLSSRWGHELRATIHPGVMALGLVMGVFLTGGSGYGGFVSPPLAKLPMRTIEGKLVEAQTVELKRTSRRGVEQKSEYELALRLEGEDLALHLGSRLFEACWGAGSRPSWSRV